MKVQWLGAWCAVLLLSGAAHAADTVEAAAPSGLPPAAEVQRAMQESPRMQIAIESIARGNALNRRYRAGPHELEVSALSQRRTDQLGQTGNELEYGLQTGVRWPWKRTLDTQIGSLALEAGELSYLDAWHEAGRTLLDHWYSWLQAEYAARLLDQQLDVLVKQQDAVARRVAAGDVARIETQLAESETLRVRGARSQMQRDARLARELLLGEFPTLPLDLPATLLPVPELAGTDEYWITQVVDHNHEIELAEARRNEAQLTAERALRDRLADPTVGLRYSKNLGGDRKVIGVTFSMPIGVAARSSSALLARSDARMADGEARRTHDAVLAAARSAVADARHSHQGWLAADAAQRQLQAVAEASARGYSLGEFDISIMLAARRTAQIGEQEQLDAMIRAQRSQARLLLDAHRMWRPADHDHDNEQ